MNKAITLFLFFIKWTFASFLVIVLFSISIVGFNRIKDNKVADNNKKNTEGRNINQNESHVELTESGINNREYIIGRWVYPGGDASPMEMIFYNNNSLEFKGGFEYYNPASWIYDINSNELSIFIPNFNINSIRAFDDAIMRKNVIRINIENKEIVYNLTHQTKYLEFANWYFFKK